MNKLVCDVCGGNIIMQAGGKVGMCNSCGLNYSLDRMREIASGVKVSQTGSAEDVEQWRELIEKYMDCGAFTDAESIVKKILEAVPDDPQANEQYDELQVLKFLVIRNGILIKYTGNADKIRIPSAAREIEESVFANKKVKEIVISEGCTSIGSNAFIYCPSLTKITLPNSLQSIGYSAFAGCTSLKEITLPDGLQSIDCSAFAGCTSLKGITLPDGLHSIEYETFEGCKSLTKITLPNSLQSIGYSAFAGCTSLTNITLPKSLKSIDRHVFKGCISLKEITLPDGLQSLEDDAFEGCTSLKKFSLPDGLKEKKRRELAIEARKIERQKELEMRQREAQHQALLARQRELEAYKKEQERQALAEKQQEEERIKMMNELFEQRRREQLEREKQQKIHNGICPACGGRISTWSKKCKSCHIKWNE